ncbi:hypothetical protein BU17DRAFT_69457 [Hysterangium stoloniferum]|nr:hypothetical protein BU17DRAFT_69457 [Hysterangium stoloniferum]
MPYPPLCKLQLMSIKLGGTPPLRKCPPSILKSIIDAPPGDTLFQNCVDHGHGVNTILDDVSLSGASMIESLLGYTSSSRFVPMQNTRSTACSHHTHSAHNWADGSFISLILSVSVDGIGLRPHRKENYTSFSTVGETTAESQEENSLQVMLSPGMV